MSNKISKNEIRQPDQFQKTLKEGFQWTTAHSKIVFSAILIFLVVGGGISLNKTFQLKKETEVQEKYFSIEKQYVEKKRNFDEALRDSKKTDSKAAPAEVAKKLSLPTGELTQDFGKLTDDFKAIIEAAPQTKAAQMAALNLSEIYVKYGQQDEALAVINRANPQDKADSMLNALVLNTKAAILADKNDCQAALGSWEKVLKSKQAQFLNDEVKLRMALCYESLNDYTKAEQFYMELSQKTGKGSESAAAVDAQKYLRLLKIKKNSSGT